MKTEWWYDDATFHYSGNVTISLARLLVRDDGTAEIFTEGGGRYEFPNEDEANLWLVSDEFRRLQSLIEDFEDEGLPLDPRIKAPEAATDEALLQQMLIELKSAPSAFPDTAPPAPPPGQTTQHDYSALPNE